MTECCLHNSRTLSLKRPDRAMFDSLRNMEINTSRLEASKKISSPHNTGRIGVTSIMHTSIILKCATLYPINWLDWRERHLREYEARFGEGEVGHQT